MEQDYEVKLSYDDISIVPETVTNIFSRMECNPFDENGMLPIFAAPMGSVIDEHNWRTFYDNKVNVVIPRTLSLDERKKIMDYTKRQEQHYHPFIAFSLDETIDLFGLDSKEITSDMDPDVMRSNHFQMRICIDLANGHMNKLLKVIKDIKKSYGDLVIIMSGNIANPNTYTEYELVGCDYVRVSIGTGSGCLTASNTGVYYPPFSLLKEMSEIRKQYHGNCKIIADGGIKGFRDIQKALIYADYVMIGGLFNKCIESSGLTTYGKSYFKVGQYKLRNYIVDLFRYGKKIDPSKYDKVIPLVKSGMLEVNKQFYGMSTKLAQKETKTNKSLKTSEGLVKTNKVEYTLEQWIENEMSYLKSAMSYTNSVDLVDYKESQWVRINQITYNK
jgi:hypothetical protein